MEGHPRNIPVYLFQNPSSSSREKSFKGFFSIFSSGSHLVQRSGRVLTILVQGHPRNLHVKLFPNQCTG